MSSTIRPLIWRRYLLLGLLLAGLGELLRQSTSKAAPAAVAVGLSDPTGETGADPISVWLRKSGVPPEGPVAKQLSTLPAALWANLSDWLSQPAARRPGLLDATSLPRQSPLHDALLDAALTGPEAPPLEDAVKNLEQILLDRDSPLRLRLLDQLIRRATGEGRMDMALTLQIDLARHPLSDWQAMDRAVNLALGLRMHEDATALLTDWLDDPPVTATGSTVQAARLALARLQTAQGDLRAAWETLAPTLDDSATPLSSDGLDLAWNIARLTQQEATLIPHLEVALQSHSQHHLHWRDLGDAPQATAPYLAGLRRLAIACEEAGQESRACEALFHLAMLDDPLQLATALPLARRMQRQAEIPQIIAHLFKRDGPDSATSSDWLLRIASHCLERADPQGAAFLLRAHLQKHPGDSAAAHLLRHIECAAMPAMQAVHLLRKHLQTQPSDHPMRLLLVEQWLRANQPLAAVNALVQTDDIYLNARLRLTSAQLALAHHQTRAFLIAAARLAASSDAFPAVELLPLMDHALALGESELASQLQSRARP